ncbi:MAG TPA: hypothetical protein VGE93_12200 [Bryobacteraceae bacterium]|nr:hypothetical protein [Acidobacteriaceae bacterium]
MNQTSIFAIENQDQQGYLLPPLRMSAQGSYTATSWLITYSGEVAGPESASPIAQTSIFAQNWSYRCSDELFTEVKRTPSADPKRTEAVLNMLVNRATEVDKTIRQRTELEWLDLHRDEYAGQWVALFGARLLASGGSAIQVRREALAEVDSPTLVKVDDSHPMIGG